MKFFPNILALIIIAVITYFFHHDDFSWIYREWKTNSYYTHGMYVLIASILFAFYRITKIDWGRVAAKGPFWFLSATFWWLISAILYWSGKAINPEYIHHYLRMLAFFFMIRGYVSFLLRERVAKGFSFPIFYPVLAIPFPFFQQISATLRDGTMYVSTWFFNAVGISSYSSEGSLVVKSIVLPIDTAFTGIESLILLVTFIVLVVYIFEYRDLIKALVIGLVTPLAFLGCVVRVLVFLCLGYFKSEQSALWYWNAWSTPLFYIVSFIFIGTAWYFVRKLVRVFPRLKT